MERIGDHKDSNSFSNVIMNTKYTGTIIHFKETVMYLFSKKLMAVTEKNKMLKESVKIIPYANLPGTGMRIAKIDAIYIINNLFFIFHPRTMLRFLEFFPSNMKWKNLQTK